MANASNPSSAPNAFSRKDQYAAKRRTLLLEAGRVFGQRGFGNSSLDEIAQNLNITKTALYYYFKSKHEMLFECYAASFDLADEALNDALAEGSTAFDKVRRFIRNYTLAGLNDLNPTMPMREVDVLTPKHRAVIESRRSALQRRLRELIQAGIAEGSIAQCEPRVLVIAIIGAVSWLLRAFNPKGELSAETVTEQIVEILTKGIDSRVVPPSARAGRK